MLMTMNSFFVVNNRLTTDFFVTYTNNMVDSEIALTVSVVLLLVAIVQIVASHYASKLRKKTAESGDSERSYLFSLSLVFVAFLALVSNCSASGSSSAASALRLASVVALVGLSVLALVFSLKVKSSLDDKDSRTVAVADGVTLVLALGAGLALYSSALGGGRGGGRSGL